MKVEEVFFCSEIYEDELVGSNTTTVNPNEQYHSSSPQSTKKNFKGNNKSHHRENSLNDVRGFSNSLHESISSKKGNPSETVYNSPPPIKGFSIEFGQRTGAIKGKLTMSSCNVSHGVGFIRYTVHFCVGGSFKY